MAVSRSQGVFVAPRTSNCSRLLPTPSICAKNSVLIRLAASDSPDSPRAPQSESTSSMKMIAGLLSLAISNKFLTSFSLSPIHFDTRSDEEMLKKVASASVAHARARWDLPVPGGPYKRMPCQGSRFPVNSCGNRVGKITVSCRASFAARSPATSSHLTFGFVVMMAPSRPLRSRWFSLSSVSSVGPAPFVGGGCMAVAVLPPGAAGGAIMPPSMRFFRSSARPTSSSRRSRTISLTFGLFSHLYTNLNTSKAFLYSWKASFALPDASNSLARFSMATAC
mmetsp:Transcript_57283/g.165988  ORF Transcript_57283/g.165988 Transcript_57283/m.165988 type:complete len:280 (+) Transcript_57283:407-1246(+)